MGFAHDDAYKALSASFQRPAFTKRRNKGKKTPADKQPASRHAQHGERYTPAFTDRLEADDLPPLETHETCVFLGDSDHMSLRGEIRLLPWLPATSQRNRAVPLAASQWPVIA